MHTKMKSRLLLNVVVRKCAAVFELLSSKNEALLIRGDSLLVLDLGFDLGTVRQQRGGDQQAMQRTLSMVSEDSTSRVMVFPVRLLIVLVNEPGGARGRLRLDAANMR